MTPQERELVTELFDRLATLESAPRDPDAERAVADSSLVADSRARDSSRRARLAATRTRAASILTCRSSASTAARTSTALCKRSSTSSKMTRTIRIRPSALNP